MSDTDNVMTQAVEAAEAQVIEIKKKIQGFSQVPFMQRKPTRTEIVEQRRKFIEELLNGQSQ